jgi:hypothetical protein
LRCAGERENMATSELDIMALQDKSNSTSNKGPALFNKITLLNSILYFTNMFVKVTKEKKRED